MKKIIYFKLTKLLVMLLTFVFGGMFIGNMVMLVDDYAEYSGQREAIFFDNVYLNSNGNTYVLNLMENDINAYVKEVFNDAITAWCEGGKEELAKYVEQHKGEFIVIAADKDNIYSSHSDIDVSGVENPMEYVASTEILYIESAFSYLIPGLWLQAGESDVKYGNEVWDKVSNYDYLEEETLKQLEAINHGLEVKICMSESYADDNWYGRNNGYAWELEEDNRNEFNTSMRRNITSAVIPGVIFIVGVVLSIILCGRTAEGLKELKGIEKTGTELHIALIIGACAGAFGVLNGLMEQDNTYFRYYMYGEDSSEWLEYFYAGMIALGVLILAIIYFSTGVIIKKLKNRCFIKDFYVTKILIKVKRHYIKSVGRIQDSFRQSCDNSRFATLPETSKMYVKKIVVDVLVLLFFMIFFIVPISIRYSDSAAAVLYGVMVLIFIMGFFIKSTKEYRQLREYNRIATAVNVISDGNYDGVSIDENEQNESLIKLANMSDSFEESVRKQVEAEKMQIELVANVSRDLNAPLASIINYVDLLKEEDMSSVAKDYVKVLVDKSSRLKDIVSDVFDLANVTNGEQIAMEQLDGIVLLHQVLSDMSDAIEESGKDIRMKLKVENAPIIGNGHKLYRVFQNILENALKYSMPGTRIYLTADNVDNEFVVTVKNISEFEMNFTSEEIMSRFTRGDKSRHSEGTGLGLSIAKSFTEVCGGSFEVELDDDEFMVTIRLR